MPAAVLGPADVHHVVGEVLPEARVREDRLPLGRRGRVLVARHRPREPLFRDGELDGHVRPFRLCVPAAVREHATGSAAADASVAWVPIRMVTA